MPPHQVDESIGLTYFREQGPQISAQAVESALRHPAELKSWYLSTLMTGKAEHLASIPPAGAIAGENDLLKTGKTGTIFINSSHHE